MPLRLSIRYKVLLLVLAVVLAALATYLTLAITLFNRDKLAYVYDLNATLAHTLGEEIQSSVRSLADRLLFFAAARPQAAPAARRKGAAARPRAATHADLLFHADPDVLSVEIWAPQRGGSYSRVYQWIDADRLAKVGIAGDDLLQARRSAPVPWAAAVAAGLHLQNASLPPDLALITLVAAVPGSRDVVVADIRPDRFLRIFGTSGIYKAYPVDSRGTVLAHPEPSRVLNRATMTDTGVVKDALEGKAKHGVLAFASPAGEDFIGAFSTVE
ncbi:MAG: cache domain-containing protein, partial [Deltaproteobacteria bacterium]|nr:cache domain-containing protein [Deltaproteobacteria bacterium]